MVSAWKISTLEHPMRWLRIKREKEMKISMSFKKRRSKLIRDIINYIILINISFWGV